ncbi:SHOCT domain-containing protein [Clostridium omnivorum]|uniref:SHOCT domain-containing protein n=1 Tax=Clostridium omnivorum TaxID=1604902 RepID=A0ABQ5N5I5_9CLOT|nr:SHOCT domain-containing protein [Clostridium sp. E14]GLC30310.1 hypothetical protein bsdE14_17200 [Clostridium sp. E14]
MFRAGFGFPAFMLLAMFLRLIFITLLIVFMGRRFRKFGRCKNSALVMLDNKFASGEITEDEYLKRRSILTQ